MEDVYYCTRIVGTCMLLLLNDTSWILNPKGKSIRGSGEMVMMMIMIKVMVTGKNHAIKLAMFPIKKPMLLVTEVLPLQTNWGLEAGDSLQDIQLPMLPLEANGLLLPLEANSLQDILVHNIIGAPVGQRKRWIMQKCQNLKNTESKNLKITESNCIFLVTAIFPFM